MAVAHAPRSLRGDLTFLWAVVGFSALLLYGLTNLGRATLAAFDQPLGPLHYAVLLVGMGLMAWFEGYRGFQQSFSPRFASRAASLRAAPLPTQTLLAPLVCMGLFWAPRRRLVAAWSLTLGIIVLVGLFRTLPQPWRGILDGAVFVGLAWGLVATWAAVAGQWQDGEAEAT